MKTYSEVKGEEPFDWYKALDDAINSDIISLEQRLNLSKRSESWITCPCGNQYDIIPRDEYSGHPLDSDLYTLGIYFEGYVKAHGYQEARKTLDEIEARSAEIIKDLTRNK